MILLFPNVALNKQPKNQLNCTAMQIFKFTLLNENKFADSRNSIFFFIAIEEKLFDNSLLITFVNKSLINIF